MSEISNEDILNHPHLKKIEKGEQTIYLLGTAHVSKQSADLAASLIETLKPEAVAIELCAPRYQNLSDPDRWKNTDLVKVFREGKIYLLLTQLLLAGFQKKIGKNLQVKPGAEMMAAAETAKSVGSEIILADREIRITLKRAWSELSLWTIFKLIFAMIRGLGAADELNEAEIERIKNSDALDELMKEFSKEFPTIRKSLIDERDQYLAGRIAQSPHKTIVAIMGAGHVPGIMRYLSEPIDFASLETLPKPKLIRKLLGWLIPGLVLLLMAKIIFETGLGSAGQVLAIWSLTTGGLAAFGALLALAHPLSILTALLVAPITSLHPLLAAGWFSGFVEAMIRKPRVGDLETVADDISSIRGIYRNRVCRILLVVCMTNLLASVGAIWGIERLFNF